MRRVMLGAVVGIVVGVACTLLVVRSAPRAALADGEPHAGAGFCMDANGDGLVDIADATYTLGYLFLGEPASVDCSTPPHEAPHLLAEIAALEAEIVTLEAELTRRGALPATGQTKCYDVVKQIPCDSGDFPGQDGFYRAGCPTEGRFVDHGDGTVTDTCTGLMWQKYTADTSRNGGPGTFPEDAVTWQDALKYCDSLDFAGHDDWRLPDIRELQSIADYRRINPAIDTTVFGAVSGWHWSSTTYFNSPGFCWNVDFYDGRAIDDQGAGGKVRADLVRAVRNSQ